MTTIRRAKASDLGALKALYREMSALHAALLPSIFRDDLGSTHPDAYWLSTLEAEQDLLLVSELDEHVVGYALVLVRDTPDDPIVAPRRLAVLEELVVRADLRRKGIGRMLLREAEGWARACGATTIELRVWEANTAACSLYDSAGYGILQRRLSKPL